MRKFVLFSFLIYILSSCTSVPKIISGQSNLIIRTIHRNSSSSNDYMYYKIHLSSDNVIKVSTINKNTFVYNQNPGEYSTNSFEAVYIDSNKSGGSSPYLVSYKLEPNKTTIFPYQIIISFQGQNQYYNLQELTQNEKRMIIDELKKNKKYKDLVFSE